MSDPIIEIVQELNASLERAKNNKTATNYELVQMKLSELKGALRELHQAMTKKEIKIIIDKLAKHAPITQDELDLMRDWIVGEAESYTANEKNFNNWLSLFDKLMKDLQELYNTDVTPTKVMQLSGLTQIGIRLIPHIVFYISEQERAAAFERAVSDGLDDFEATAYHDILMAKMESSNY